MGFSSSKKKPISDLTITSNNKSDDHENNSTQVCNPPYVYSLSWSKSGKKLSAGTGDGHIGLFEINNRRLVQTQSLVGHQSSVASVVFPFFTAGTHDRILISGGTDGNLVFWDLGLSSHDYSYERCLENQSDSAQQLFNDALLQKLTSQNRQVSKGTTNHRSLNYHEPALLFQINHNRKINWVTKAIPSLNGGPIKRNDTIFVADTTNDITSYTIPFS